jgi:protein-L-isoaspartate(D-aspartate) O-methyltransferase
MTNAAETEWFERQRGRMVEVQLRQRGIKDERVLDAMARVPRHEFAPNEYCDQTYEDHPLPIGEGQTISQPYIVALMLEALGLKPSHRVLEIGTGSGYATALLAELAGEVISIERHPALAKQARELLQSLGYRRVSVMVGDGALGFSSRAPYDAILVSAATPEVPSALLAQLGEGGQMIIPVGGAESQRLELIGMHGGRAHTTLRGLCRFVPLVSDGVSSARPLGD